MDLDDVAELSAFVRDGKLVSIPRRRTKRMILLDRLAQEFEPGARLPRSRGQRGARRGLPRLATLRRALVDEGLLDRDAGQYWRSGGSVD